MSGARAARVAGDTSAGHAPLRAGGSAKSQSVAGYGRVETGPDRSVGAARDGHCKPGGAPLSEAPSRGGRSHVLPEKRRGAVAQMGERCNRTAEVRGSIPLSSTTSPGNHSSLGQYQSEGHASRLIAKRQRRYCRVRRHLLPKKLPKRSCIICIEQAPSDALKEQEVMEDDRLEDALITKHAHMRGQQRGIRSADRRAVFVHGDLEEPVGNGCYRLTISS